MIQIDYSDPRPIYEQIAERYKLLILKGALAPGEQMPSVRSLAMELSANPNTVQKAFSELERQGFIHSVKGRGSFVASNPALLEERKVKLAQEMAEKMREALSLGISREDMLKAVQEAEKHTN